MFALQSFNLKGVQIAQLTTMNESGKKFKSAFAILRNDTLFYFADLALSADKMMGATEIKIIPKHTKSMCLRINSTSPSK